MCPRPSQSDQVTDSSDIAASKHQITTPRFYLVNCLPDQLASFVVARRNKTDITANQYLQDVWALAMALPVGKHCINVCQDRYNIAVLIAAVMLRNQVSLFPPNTAALTLDSLRVDHEQTYSVCDAVSSGRFQNALVFESLISNLSNDQQDSSAWIPDYPTLSNPDFPADQIVGILFTSGSTGSPMPNPRQWGALCKSARAEAQALGVAQFPETPTVIGTVPAQHSYGLESTIAMCLQNRFTISADASFFPADIWAAVANTPRPRVLVTTPYHLRLLLDSLQQVDSPNDTQLDLVVSATAPLPPQLANQVQLGLGCPVKEIYGSTESGQIASRQTTQTDCWTLFPGTALHMQDGDAWVSGGHVESPKILNDVIEILPNHEFRLFGRTGDMVNLAGKRSSLGHLSFHLNSIAGVQDGVFFLPDAANQKPDQLIVRLQAIAVSKTLSSAQILTELRDRIDPVFLPRTIHLVAEIPRNETGKITQAQLIALISSSPKALKE
jgi:acyl-coenzyme A synthetase/AMP-(fatty) acid ligase